MQLVLKAVNYGQALKSVYMSCTSTLLPIIRDYRKGIINNRWTYLKMIVKQMYVVFQEAGIISFLQHIIVTFVCPGIGHIIVSIINMFTANMINKNIEKQIHTQLDKYEKDFSKNVLAPDHKPHSQHKGIYNNVLKELKLPHNTQPAKALIIIQEKREKIKADETQSIWEHLKIYKKQIIVKAYLD